MRYQNKEVSKETLSKYFRYVAGTHLADCSNHVQNLSDVLTDDIISHLRGDNILLTKQVLADAMSLAFGETTFCMPNSLVVSMTMGIKGSPEEYNIPERLYKFGFEDGIVHGYSEKSDVKGIVFDDDDESENGEEVYSEEEVESVEDIKEDLDEDTGDVEEAEKQPEESEEEKFKKAKKEKICDYYAAFYDKEDLLKRYSALFSSGYEVNKPDGLLCKDGIVKVSGSKRVVYEDSVSTAEIYNIITSRFNFIELPNRSIASVASAIVNEYMQGSRLLLYFPNKLLEFAYGLECPAGENAESINSYQRHADAKSWTKFKEGELSKALTKTLRGLCYVYVAENMRIKNTEDYKDSEIRAGLKDFMNYAKSCLSLCFLFTDYKFTKDSEGTKSVSKFVLRICDPSLKLLSIDLTQAFITEAFLGSSGKDPFSYQPRLDEGASMVEYSHEFNHALAQATPVFAFKALQSLIRDGKSISWENLILGKGEDGAILKCGPGQFIDLAKALTHQMDAGSRAGKGVMTLNLLASATASFLNSFYLDRKPDMSSILKFICPEMFVVNGGGYAGQYDSRQQWGPEMMDAVASLNIPQEALDVFEVRSANWSELGDLFYMRALMLVVGIILARGAGRGTDPEWGGPEGICLIVDEFRVFQSAYRSLMNRVFAKIPNTVLNKAREQLAKGTLSQVEFERCYNDAGYYALSYVNSLADSLQFLIDRRDAGFDEAEKKRSDIFVIGQDLYDGPINVSEFVNSFMQSSASNRYKTMATGMNSAFGNDVCNAETSIPYSMLNIKGMDAFFGRNIDTNYLAQTNQGSKAYGRLDDKASNFAYLPTFTEEVRKTLNSGNVPANMSIASRCKYFKPYLILNDYQNNDGSEAGCVTGVFDRCFKEAGISREEIISENHADDDPSALNPAVGFLNYIEMAGVSNYRESMGKGGQLAQRVVEKLGYTGTWLEFICDLRPEWMFTFRDIVDVSQGVTPSLANPATNKIHKEWVDFNPGRFSDGYVDPQELSGRINDEFIEDNGTREDFSDDTIFNDSDERMASLFEEEFGGSNSGDVNLFEDESFEDDVDLFGDDTNDYQIQDVDIEETGFDNQQGTKQTSAEMQQLIELVQQLQQQVAELQSQRNTSDMSSPYQYNVTEDTDFSPRYSGINYREEDEEVTLTQMISFVTGDILKKFGGAMNFKSLRILGGSIIVNGYCYKCKISDTKGVPYDIRRKINAGHIAELYNYQNLPLLKNLREFEVDSVNFAYDYVAKQIGAVDNFGVDILFKNIPALQIVKIGKKVFTKKDYTSGALYEEENNMYAQASTATRLSMVSESYLTKWRDGSWGITKNLASGWKNHKVINTVGILAAGTATVATGVAGAGINGARKIATAVNNKKNSGTHNQAKETAKGFLNGLKDLLK